MSYLRWPKGTRVRLSEVGKTHLKPQAGSAELGTGTIVFGTQKNGFVNVQWDGQGPHTRHHYREDFIKLS